MPGYRKTAGATLLLNVSTVQCVVRSVVYSDTCNGYCVVCSVYYLQFTVYSVQSLYESPDLQGINQASGLGEKASLFSVQGSVQTFV